MKKTDKKPAEKWINALKVAENEFKTWTIKGDKIVKRYRDERSATVTSDKKYNILWANVQTLFPAVYSRKPKAQCDRRYKDKDPVGRTAAQILERALQFEIDHYNDYDSAIRNALKDRLLPGRGVAWVRYEPTYGQGQEITDDVQEDEVTERTQEIETEYTPCDYVFWKDFRHSPARTWEEVTWIARRVYMEREAGIKRFGDKFKEVPLSHEPLGLDDKDLNAHDLSKKAIVWEIWNKPTGQAIWVAENYSEILDEKSDPLELDCFFPIPKPLFSTLTTDSLIPVADYLEYQDQAMEIDELTARIGKLVDALKVVGVYDASQKGVERMMLEGVNNDLIPVENWAGFSEKGGLKGVVDWLPMDMVVKALQECYLAREQAKQVIYEITGLSDIIRGASQASETATAQQIKSNFASLRLKEIQNSVAVFASELLNIKAQIMCRAYQPETLVAMSGIMNTLDAQYVPQAIQLLKNGTLREFRIEVESDSLIELDERGEQEARTQFLSAVGGFLKEAIQAPPTLAPLLGEMLLFGVRGFRVGRDIENAFDEAMEKLKQPPPQQNQPSPDEIKAQADMQKHQAQLQADQQQAQIETQLEQQRLAMESQAREREQQLQAQIEQQRNQMEYQRQLQQQQHEAVIEQMKTQADNQTKLLLAHIDRVTKLETAEISAQATLSAQQQSAAEGAADA